MIISKVLKLTKNIKFYLFYIILVFIVKNNFKQKNSPIRDKILNQFALLLIIADCINL